jgi:DNA polymerase III delta prime subunit
LNIKRVKEEIKDSIESYLLKDDYGNYVIPVESQRPLLLIGPPGIGKTAIMKQIAAECEIGLVAYTITHHTRQSAIGLPFIEEETFGGKKYSVTEYTMSEIVASVYKQMEETGLKEGILFIDEINCASETLAPAMLQFLQYKTFGSHKIPDGWIIVAAGNPPEYNKSVREFDIVTLDRVKKIDVDEDYSIWKEYAVRENIHNAIISYLDIKKENFYCVKNTAEGKIFQTARGWEDLSRLMYVYEKLGKTVDFDVVYQYIQNKKVARDFASYIELYNKYKKDYSIPEILEGNFKNIYVDRLRTAGFDERLSVVGLLLGALNDRFREADFIDCCAELLQSYLKELKSQLLSQFAADKHPEDIIVPFFDFKGAAFEKKIKNGIMKKEDEKTERIVLEMCDKFNIEIKKNGADSCEKAFDIIKELFSKEVSKRQEFIDKTSDNLNNVFEFMETAFGHSQEMIVFVTELNSGYYSIKFIDENGCTKFYQYNRDLLYKERQKNIINDIDDLRDMLW